MHLITTFEVYLELNNKNLTLLSFNGCENHKKRPKKVFDIDFGKCCIPEPKQNIWNPTAFDLIFHLVYIFFYFGHAVFTKIYV